MPKEITHIHIANIALDHYSADVSQLLTKQKRIYEIGSVAPDLYYYDIPLPLIEKSIIPWGEKIHGRDGNDTMLHVFALLDHAKAIQSVLPVKASKIFAFTCGFLTHIAADTIFHPYIYSITGNYYADDLKERRLASSRHRLFESCLDQYILLQNHQSLKSFHLHDRIRFESKADADFILNSLADAMSQSHDSAADIDHVRRITHRSYRRALQIISLFQLRPFAQTIIHLNRLVFLEGRFDAAASTVYGPHTAQSYIDFANLPDTPHPVLGTTLKAGNVLNLIDKSTHRCIDFITAAYNYYTGQISIGQAKKILRPYSLNNGLERTRTDAMQYFKVMPALTLR